MNTPPKPPRVADDRVRAYLDRCQALIDEHGHMVQSVFADARTPDFAYTIGLSTRGLPELVVIGLPSETATHALNQIAQRLAKDSIPDHQDITEIANMPLRLRTVDPDAAWVHMGVARSLLQTRPTAIRQVLWPDPSGRFPGDPAYQFPVTQTLDELTPDPRTH